MRVAGLPGYLVYLWANVPGQDSVSQTEALPTIVGMIVLTLLVGHPAAVVQKRTDFAQVAWLVVQGGQERSIGVVKQRKQCFPTSFDIAEICSGNKHSETFRLHAVEHTHLRCRRSDCTERNFVCGKCVQMMNVATRSGLASMSR